MKSLHSANDYLQTIIIAFCYHDGLIEEYGYKL